MFKELEYEFSQFKNDFGNGSLVFGSYFDEDDYEDEYSHNEIDEYKAMFDEKVREFLHENAPNKYVVISDWCVFIMNIEEAKKRKMCGWEDYIIE